MSANERKKQKMHFHAQKMHEDVCVWRVGSGLFLVLMLRSSVRLFGSLASSKFKNMLRIYELNKKKSYFFCL